MGESDSKLGAIGLIAALTLLYAVSALWRPPDGDYFTICGFKNFTGLPCPGCGLTHSFCAVGKGDIPRAFADNLLGPPLFLFSLLIWFRSVCAVLNRKRALQVLDNLIRRLRPAHLFLVAFAVFGVARIGYLLIFGGSGHR